MQRIVMIIEIEDCDYKSFVEENIKNPEQKYKIVYVNIFSPHVDKIFKYAKRLSPSLTIGAGIKRWFD